MQLQLGNNIYDYLFISNRKTYRFVLCLVKTQNHIWCKSNNTLRSHGRETMHTNISTYNRQWNVTNDDDKMLEVQRDHTNFFNGRDRNQRRRRHT